MVLRGAVLGVVVTAAAVVSGASNGADMPKLKQVPVEAYIQEPLPPFVQVVGTEMDGPLFADTTGHTLYTWPARGQSDAGTAGEREGKPTCDDTHYKKTAGFMSPFPPGLELPDLDSRPTCLQLWPAVYAADDAKPVGKWTIVARADGRKQWAYGGQAVYTSALDHGLGDVIGSSTIRPGGDAGAIRDPIGPKPDVPAQFAVATIPAGRLLTLVDGFSVYTWDKDGPNKSNCAEACQRSWQPVLAAMTAPQARGDWAAIERSPGVWQWTYRKKPLYTLVGEDQTRSFHGADVSGWHNVFAQRAPSPPKGFTVQDSPGGQVLADSHGRTIYHYNCIDDAMDQQSCDHPSTNQQYRLAVCGGFDAARCLATFPYVIADKDAKSDSRIWAIKDIDPQTGHFAQPGQPGALRVWTYRDRPVYTFAHDQGPGDSNADSWGENTGWRNGFHAFWVREEFRRQY